MKNQHWADTYADKIIRERGETVNKLSNGVYTCASGITPSGTVHIGNFREIISVELVVRALRSKGVASRFIYSWDDFDVFRKIPANIPQQDEFVQYLRMPITDIPDPFTRAENYALANEAAIEHILAKFGMHPEYIYQAKAYRAGNYAEGIKLALQNRAQIRDIMNSFRTTPLSEDWWPISVFSGYTNKDNTLIKSWDGKWQVRYYCKDTKQEASLDIRSSKDIKLLWRIDWPMRWDYEKVVFEPAGKDHHSQGGSFDTARAIVKEVYKYDAPVTFQYDFVRIKGGSGKLSSSSGEVVSVDDVLEVYQPEIIRYLFASTRPNAEFAISFDLDVIKIYEDYDRCERIYYGKEEVGEARKTKETRVYELSQIHEMPPTTVGAMPLQLPIRHLCNILQIFGGDFVTATKALQEEYGEAEFTAHKQRHLTRMHCAWNWICNYAPEDFRFSLRAQSDLALLQEPKSIQGAISALQELLLSNWDSLTDKEVNSHIYEVARNCNIEPAEFFISIYQRLIAKEKGPRLGSFLRILGKDIIEVYFSM